ncbi:class II glutamine amidotransferase [Candidatus Woesearchaeota archaeon]|nr:class II glutamine amidotransferase [Candidatus Woesearchaeota archaeon]
MAYLQDKSWILKKLPPSFLDDSQTNNILLIQSSALLLHARKKSKSDLEYHNTHPFQFKEKKEDIVLAHNGTIS